MTPLCVQAEAMQSATAPTPAAHPAAVATSTRIITIGTGGGPRPSASRGQPANIVRVGDRIYLVDAGPGVSDRLAAVRIGAEKVDKVFLTHLHFDHSGGLNSLLGFAWVRDANRTVDIYGPPATGAFVDAGARYLAMTMQLYAVQMAPRPSIAQMVKVHDVDVTRPTVIYRDDKVRVTAVENSHYDTLPANRRPLGGTRSYSYRFDTPDRSVVFTGDTGPSDGLIELSKGADVLVSMVRDIDQALIDLKYDGKNEKLKPLVDHYRNDLLSPQEVGRIAAKAGVKLVVLTHISQGDDTEKGMSHFREGVRGAFAGPVLIARDGSEF